MSQRHGEFDVIIAGGGMVGACLAAALAPSGWRIALVDPFVSAVDASPSFDERATALSWSSRQFFQALGLWRPLQAQASSIQHIHVSEKGRFARARLHAQDMGLDALGHVVPNRVIGEVLASRLAELDNISLIASSLVDGPRLEADWVRVETEEQSTLSTRLLVAADGAQSRIRSKLNISAHHTHFPYRGLVANVAVEKPHHGWAYERFTESGPLALLPLPAGQGGGHRMNLVMSLPVGEAEDLRGLSEDALMRLVRLRFGAHLGAFEHISQPAIYPLTQVRARRLNAERVVLAGNAASTLHPVAGQGFNLALRGVADLSDALLQQARVKGDPGDSTLLAAHAHRRQSDVRWTAGWTRALVEGFVVDWPLAGHFRNKALLGLDRIPPLRRWFTRQALGQVSGLSPLARGIHSHSGDR